MEITTEQRQSIALPINESSQVGDARRIAARLTAELGLSETERGAASIVVTELANNLVKYAQEGQIVLRALGRAPELGVEILSLDKGPGIADVARSLTDGYSTGGTPGTGLGAVRRLSALFEIYSAADAGTAIVSHIIPSSTEPSRRRIETGGVCVPAHANERCGDSWAVFDDGTRCLITIVDGLGHGTIASEAADEAMGAFNRHTADSAVEIVQTAHTALRTTRGAVMAVAETNLVDGSVSYCGVGNIAGSVVGETGVQHMISVNGTLGLMAKPKAFSYVWNKSGVLIMASDGMQTRWQLDKFPGLLKKHPSIIAGMLYQHFSRGRDDVTVLAARWNDN